MMMDTSTQGEVGKEDRNTKRPCHSLGISDFSDDLVEEIFKFLGRGHFVFVAGTSRQFYRTYKTMCENNDNDTPGTTTRAARKTEYRWTTTTMRNAVESVSRLQWARAYEYPWNERTCASAAENGHLEVLKWARENGCPWDGRTCTCAAENGHFEVLQ